MDFFLQPDLLDPSKPIEIDRQVFVDLQQARKVLSVALAIEERYDLVLGNFLELESTLLAWASRASIFRLSKYEQFFELNSEIARRMVNLLTAVRLYVDQLPQLTNELSVAKLDTKRLLNAAYDDCFEYRFMEALRNFVQHSGLPVHLVKFGDEWVGETAASGRESFLQVFCYRKELDDKFKRSVYQEMPERVDLLWAARSQLEKLGEVQQIVRKQTAPVIEQSRARVDSAIHTYRQETGFEGLGLTAFGIDAEGKQTKLPIFVEWDEVRVMLSKRNLGLVNFRWQFVSSRTSELKC